MYIGLPKQHLRFLAVVLFFLLAIVTRGEAAFLQVPGAYPTIQAAIDAAVSGDVVLVSPGTYQERLVLKPGITLQSVGNGTRGRIGLRRAEMTVIDGGGESGSRPGVTMAEGSRLDGFTITNVGRYDDAAWTRHQRTQGNEQRHDDIGRRGIAAVAVPGIAECVVTNTIVHHNGFTGILVTGEEGRSMAPQLIGNICYRNMGGGIGLINTSAAIVARNICFENFYAGIGLNRANAVITHNTCSTNIRAGIGISNGSCPQVRWNRCSGNGRAGIGIRTGDDTRPTVENNLCTGNKMAGIGISDHARPIIRNNRCTANRLAGIGARTFARPEIIGNHCSRNHHSGIGASEGAKPVIRDNECCNNDLAGISHQGNAETAVINNYCHHNGAGGIVFFDCRSGRATVRNNRVIDNELVAVGIHDGWTVRLESNELSRSGGLPPIARVYKGATATFVNNKIRGGGVAGIMVGGTVTARDNRIEGLALRTSGPPNLAVWALDGADVSMSGNHITTWQHALYATAATVHANRNTVLDFHGTAFMIHNSRQPADVFENIVVSENSDDRVLEIHGERGKVADNELRLPESPRF
jgi:parallel beta-helix repeat protein